MTTAILIPTLNRPQRIQPTLDSIERATPEPHKIYWCASDAGSIHDLDIFEQWFINDLDDNDRRYVTRMNRLARAVDDDTEFIFFGSDDVVFHPGWLREALKVFRDPKVQLVVVNDLRNPNGTQAVIRREYLELSTFDAPGDAFHGGYLHNFADTEQFFTAHKRGVYARAMESYVEHLHPLFGAPNSIAWDPTYTNAQHGWDHDSALYNRRAREIDATIS